MDDASPRWLTEVRRAVEQRWVILVVVSVASAIVAGGRGDWDLFVDAGRDLVRDSGWGLYVQRSDVQTGPLTLLAAAALSVLPRDGFVAAVVIVNLLGLAVVRAIERRCVDDLPATQLLTGRAFVLVGGSVAVFTWAKLGGDGHLDDAVVLTIAAGAVLSLVGSLPLVDQDRATWWRALAIGAAIVVKPWAVIFLPLVAAPSWRSHRWRLAVMSTSAATGIAVLAWAPFVIAHPQTLDALRPTLDLADDAVMRLFGVNGDDVPTWIRSAQLVACTAAVTWCVTTGRTRAALMVAVAIRLATDLGTWSYYTPGLIVGALVFDARRARPFPPVTLFVAAMIVPDWLIGEPMIRAAMRLAACLVVIGAAVRSAADPPEPVDGVPASPVRISEPTPSAGRSRPTSGPSATG
jgi:hypothetical protein